MVWEPLLPTRREMERHLRRHDEDVCRERTPSVPSIQVCAEGKIHSNADPITAELLLKTIVAVNQLSMYGAVGKWCNESHVNYVLPSRLVMKLTKHENS